MNRSASIKKVSLISIGANVLLVIFKAAVGLISGSIAIILDAVNNLADALGSGIAILGVILAGKKPDSKHPFGYGRIEYLSAVVISAIVLFAGISSIIESVKSIFNPEPASYNWVTILIVVSAIFAKILLGGYVKKQGKKLESESLVASGTEAIGDAALSASTLLAIAASAIWGISIEGYVGAVISLMIVKAGAELMLSSLSNILGKRTQGELASEIKSEIAAVDGVLGVYDLILHDYGPDSAMGSVHVEVSDSASATDIHKIIRHIQLAVAKRFHIILTVGIYAANTTDPEVVQMKEHVKACALQQKGVTGFHAFFMEGNCISFDLVVDFNCNIPAACEAIKAAVLEQLPSAEVLINIDKNYTD